MEYITKPLITATLARLNLNHYDEDAVREIANALFGCVRDSMLCGKNVFIPNMGMFSLKYCAARSYTVPNRKTGVSTKGVKDGHYTPAFKFDTAFKLLIETELPDDDEMSTKSELSTRPRSKPTANKPKASEPASTPPVSQLYSASYTNDIYSDVSTKRIKK